ncbi:MAG: universal stress protein [Muribaculaceae bacterium]|nr:universal stress protein [Muribaculaceae bacterium]
MTRFITVAIHTFDRALALRSLLESEGIEVMLQNVNLTDPEVASGVRVRIPEDDLPLALRIIESADDASVPHPAAEGHSIIVPTDFSDLSLQAASLAADLAAKHGATLRLLHAYIDPYVAANMQLSNKLTYEIADADSRQRLESAARMRMDHFTERMAHRIKDRGLSPVKYTTRIAEGVPEDAIAEYGKLNPPVLVVMGTRSSERKQRELIGSVSAEVIDTGRFAVLTVPEDSDRTAAQAGQILMLCYLDQADMLVLDSLMRLIKPAPGTTITLLPVAQRKRITRSIAGSPDALLGYCRAHYPDMNFELADAGASDIVAEVCRLDDSRHFGLVTVPGRRKSLFSRVFSSGTANSLLFHADLPMLTVPV